MKGKGNLLTIFLVILTILWGISIYKSCVNIQQKGLKYYFEELWEGENAHK